MFKDILFIILDLIVPTAGHCLFLTFITHKFYSMSAISLPHIVFCEIDQIFIELYFHGKY